MTSGVALGHRRSDLLRQLGVPRLELVELKAEEGEQPDRRGGDDGRRPVPTTENRELADHIAAPKRAHAGVIDEDIGCAGLDDAEGVAAVALAQDGLAGLELALLRAVRELGALVDAEALERGSDWIRAGSGAVLEVSTRTG